MFILQGPRSAIRSVAFSPGGTRLAAGGHHGVVQVWDLQTRGCVRRANWVDVVSRVVFLSDDRLLACLGHVVLRTLGVERGEEGYCHRVNRGYATALAAAPDGAAVCLAENSRVSRWSLSKPRRVWTTGNLAAGVTSIDWSADGRTVAVGRNDGRVLLLDAVTGVRLGLVGKFGAAAVHAVALSPDGSSLAWSGGPRLRIQRLSPRGPCFTHHLGRTHFQGVAWHPSGGFLATAHGDGTIDFWDAATGERRESFDWKIGKAHAVAFDATGDRAACGAETGTVVVWDVDR